MKDSYIMLNAVLKELNKIDGIVFYSIFMLPETQDLEKNYNLFLKSKKNLHFALEEIVLINLSSIKEIENIIKINKNSKKYKLLMRKKILITGHTGHLGSFLYDYFK